MRSNNNHDPEVADTRPASSLVLAKRLQRFGFDLVLSWKALQFRRRMHALAHWPASDTAKVGTME